MNIDRYFAHCKRSKSKITPKRKQFNSHKISTKNPSTNQRFKTWTTVKGNISWHNRAKRDADIDIR